MIKYLFIDSVIVKDHKNIVYISVVVYDFSCFCTVFDLLGFHNIVGKYLLQYLTWENPWLFLLLPMDWVSFWLNKSFARHYKSRVLEFVCQFFST
jgi:hypothetical protein